MLKRVADGSTYLKYIFQITAIHVIPNVPKDASTHPKPARSDGEVTIPA
jgi:hypothetical protein